MGVKRRMEKLRMTVGVKETLTKTLVRNRLTYGLVMGKEWELLVETRCPERVEKKEAWKTETAESGLH